MTIRQFIKENREMIDHIILAIVPTSKWFNDEVRRQWIHNHDGLNAWAKGCGVRI